MQHEHAGVVPGVAHGHVWPTAHGAAHQGDKACPHCIGVGFGGVATSAGHVAHQAIQAGRVWAWRVAVVVQAVVVSRIGQDVEVAAHCITSSQTSAQSLPGFDGVNVLEVSPARVARCAKVAAAC